jgi:hypothetical protein
MTRSTILRYFSASVLLVVSLFLAAGCGGGPPRASVEGTVTYDGTPIDGGQISFLSVEAKGLNADAEIKDGKYHLDANKGPALGGQRVRILWFKKTGKQVVGNDPPNLVDETIQVIPKKYNDPTGLTADIKAGKNTFNFELKYEKERPGGKKVNRD